MITDKDYLLTGTTTRDFQKAQANILLTDTQDNQFMEVDNRYTLNKALNTTKKNIIGAINEVFDIASQAAQRVGLKPDIVTSVNGKKPDVNGDVRISRTLEAECDHTGRNIAGTYATLEDIEALKARLAFKSDLEAYTKEEELTSLYNKLTRLEKRVEELETEMINRG